jgi:hypothetical protein
LLVARIGFQIHEIAIYTSIHYSNSFVIRYTTQTQTKMDPTVAPNRPAPPALALRLEILELDFTSAIGSIIGPQTVDALRRSTVAIYHAAKTIVDGYTTTVPPPDMGRTIAAIDQLIDARTALLTAALIPHLGPDRPSQ